jgi:protein TonB
MREAKRYSSLPIVLAASGGILMIAALGWFLTGGRTAGPAAADIATGEVASTVRNEDATGASGGDSPDVLIERVLALSLDQTSVGTAPIDADAELRKARFAAAAEMLVTPPEQNALYFYSRAIAADPDNADAISELDAVLARVALSVSNDLAAGKFDEAYALTALVAARRPDHPLVESTRDAIDSRASQLVGSAAQYAEAGDDAAAAAALDEAAALPGLNPAFVTAAMAGVAEVQQSRADAELAETEAKRLADEEATAEWTGKVRGAIKSGRLVSPTGDNARDYLAERETPKEAVDLLTDELLVALILESQLSLEAGDISRAEDHFSAASELRADAAGLAEMRDRLERRIIADEEAKVLGLNDFVRLDTTPARYPRLANQRNITGWVDVQFTVTQTGSTADIEVVAAEPESIFDESALEAVERWTFQPREFRGQRLNQRASARLVFRLE